MKKTFYSHRVRIGYNIELADLVYRSANQSWPAVYMINIHIQTIFLIGVKCASSVRNHEVPHGDGFS